MPAEYDQDVYTAEMRIPSFQWPEIFIRTVGELRSKGHFSYQQLARSFCFHFICSGSGIMDMDRREYEVSEGGLFVFWPGAHIKYYDFPESPWRYKWFPFEGAAAEKTLREAGINPEKPFKQLGGNSAFAAFIGELLDVYKRGGHSCFYPGLAAWRCLDAVCGDGEKSHPASGDIAEKCRCVIENSVGKFPSVDELAERFDVDRTTIFRVFKKKYACSPQELMEKIRFKRACEFLRKSSLEIGEIAVSCGFREQYFSAAFRKRFGMSPTEWRNNSSITNDRA